jgi:hypothetical protein
VPEGTFAAETGPTGGVGLDTPVSGVSATGAAALPDLSTLPPALEAAAGSSARPAPAPRVASPSRSAGALVASPAASVGRGLRDDDVSGLYVAVGAAAALMALVGFLLPGLGRRKVAGAARSVLKLP